MKKFTIALFLILSTSKLFSQYFDKNYQLAYTGCCSVQSAGLDLFYVSKKGNFYSTAWASSGLWFYPDGTFRCYKTDNTQWGLTLSYTYQKNITGIQVDDSGNTIASGFAYNTLYFDTAHNYYFTNGEFYVKFDTIGNPQWVVPRFGKYHVVDKAGGFVSVKADSTFKYDVNGNIIWTKPVGAKNSASSSYYNDYYYLLDSTVLSKCDTAGNFIWTNNSFTGNKLIADSSENIYIRNANIIYKLDSAGNFIFSKTYSVFKDFAVDKAGNIYILEKQTIRKYDTSGNVVLWSYGITAEVENLQVGVDENYNVYFGLYYISYDYTGPQTGRNPLFLPPNFYSLGTGDGQIDSHSILAARIRQDSLPAPDTIITGYIYTNARQNMCTGITFDVQFTVNRYPLVLPFTPLFKVQLSDSSGNFSNATIIGTGNNSPVACTIPPSTIPGNNYRIRVILADSSLIGSLNQNGPLQIRTSPTPVVTATNATYQSGVFLGCQGIPVLLNANTNINYTYAWFNYVSNSWGMPPTYYPISGATDSSYASTTGTAHALLLTDTSTGCARYSPPVYTAFDNPLVSFNGIIPSVCMDHVSFNINGYPAGGIFSGGGMNGNTFYPDSAGIGTQLITYTTSSIGCGVIDSTISITVNALPQLIVTGLPDTICTGYAPVLINTLPAGGALFGTGIIGNYFYPDSASFGINLLSYQFTDSNNCSDSVSQSVFVDACTGFTEINNASISIVPNPVFEKIYITTTEYKKNYTVSIYDYSGRLLFQNNDCAEIDMSKYRKGIYTVKAEGEDFILNKRIIKL